MISRPIQLIIADSEDNLQYWLTKSYCSQELNTFKKLKPALGAFYGSWPENGSGYSTDRRACMRVCPQIITTHKTESVIVSMQISSDQVS